MWVFFLFENNLVFFCILIYSFLLEEYEENVFFVNYFLKEIFILIGCFINISVELGNDI